MTYAYTVRSAPIRQRVKFPGQYYDAESGLYYNWSRYCDPTMELYVQT